MASYLGTRTNDQSASPSRPRPGELHTADFCLLPRPSIMPVLHTDASFGSDLSPEDAVLRLQDLMRENQELKSTVRDNNDMMKRVQTVLMEMKTNWDREKEEGMRKFEHARSVVTALRKDVDAKKAKIEALEDTCKKGAVAPSSLESLSQEMEQYRNNLRCLKKEQDIQNREMENLRLKMERSQKRSQEASEEVTRLTEQLRERTGQLESLEDKMSELVAHNKKQAEQKQLLSSEKQELVTQINELQSKLSQFKLSPAAPFLGPDSDSLTSSRESFVLVDNQGDVRKQTIQKQVLREAESEAEKKSLAKYSLEHTSEKLQREAELPSSDIFSLLQSERSKVSELTAKITELTEALAMSAHDLQIKDESLTNLRCSLDDQMKLLLTEHEEKRGELLREVDSMARQLHSSTGVQSVSEVDSIGNMKAQVVSLLHEVEESNRRLNITNSTARRLQQRCEELERRNRQLQEDQDTQRSKDDHLIEALRMAVSTTEASLATQKEKNEHQTSQIQDHVIETQDLKQECSGLRYQLEENKKKAGTQSPAGSVVMTLSQKRKMEEKIDNLTAQLLSAEELMGARQEEIQKLKEKLILIRNETEDIPYLKAQIDSYKSDFEAQRKANERLYKEKMSLREELDSLRVINSKLRDQHSPAPHHRSPAAPHHSLSHPPHHPVAHNYYSPAPTDRDRMRSRPYTGGGYDECDINAAQRASPGRVPTEHSTTHGSAGFEAAAAIADEAMRNQYVCPRCGLKTQDIDSMTIHVDECLQDNS